MNKVQLKAKWSKYTNTDVLVDQVRELLRENNHSNSIHGVCVMIDEYFTQNAPMIEMFMTSKNYIGDMRIAIQKEFDRKISNNELNSFFYNIDEKLDIRQILKFVDADGKRYQDYLYTGKNLFSLSNLPNANDQTQQKKKLNQFEYGTLATVESYQKYTEFMDYMYEFSCHPYSKLSRDIHMNVTKDAPLLRKGTKTSRAFNAVCQHYGVDKFNPTVVESTDENGNVTKRTVYPYNKIFAEYSDLVSDLTRKMWFIISLNPLDYLTMSNGVSWHSCHNLGPSGCYKGGTLSYMLDKTSIITYVVSELGNPLHETPKFYRQMFHYDNNLFMQNRLYPQGNDGATDLYEKFRGFIIEEFADLLHIDGEWDVEIGPNACVNHTNSIGAHYKDYHGNRSCAVFYPIVSKNRIVDHVINIGHAGICPKCGKPYTCASRLSHDTNDRECTT